MKAIQQHILQACNMTEEQYQNHLFETGMATVEHMSHGNINSAMIVAQYKFYWNWFKNIWEQHDNQWYVFYRLNMRSLSRHQCEAHYLDFHKAAAFGATPMAKHVENSYHNFIHLLNKERQHERV